MKVAMIDGRKTTFNDRHPFRIERFKSGVRVFVNDRWWPPPQEFRVGYDQEEATFDTVENAISALQYFLGSQVFVLLDDGGNALERFSPRAVIRRIKQDLGLS